MCRYVPAARLALAALALALAVAACSPGKKAEPASSPVPAFLDTQIAPRPAATSDTLTLGKTVYDRNCARCHGEASISRAGMRRRYPISCSSS